MKRHLNLPLISSVLLLIVLVVVLVLLWPRQQSVDSIRSAQPAAGPATAQPIGPRSTPGLSGNLVPINNVDPLTGKPVSYGSPVTTYKGHVIGFCCKKSPGFNGSWDLMSEADKDAFVARFTR